MQSGPIWRDVYFIPPQQLGQRGEYWKLIKLPYGISEAGRQWLKVVEFWMNEHAELTSNPQLGRIFLKRNASAKITLIAAKNLDEFLISVFKQEVSRFNDRLCKRFQIGLVQRGKCISFNGSEITMEHDAGANISMPKYLEHLSSLNISRNYKRQRRRGIKTWIQTTVRNLNVSLEFHYSPGCVFHIKTPAATWRSVCQSFNIGKCDTE